MKNESETQPASDGELAKLRSLTSSLQAELAAYKGQMQHMQSSLQEASRIRYAIDQHSIISITDAEGVIMDVNDGFCNISGYAKEELIGHTHQVVNSGYHPNDFFGNLYCTIKQGNIWRGIIRNKAKNGEYFWVDMVITPIMQENGVPSQYIAIHTDISKEKLSEQRIYELLTEAQSINQELQQNEAELRHTLEQTIELKNKVEESEARYRIITESMQDLICLHQPDGTYTYISPSVKFILGYQPEELEGKNPYDYIHATDLLRIEKESHQKVLSGTSVVQTEYRFRKKDGEYIWLETITRPVRDNNNNITALHTSSREITRRKQIEKIINFTQFSFNAVSDAIIWLDASGQIIQGNPAIGHLLGYTETELVQLTIFDIDKQVSPESHKERWRRLKAAGTIRFEVKLTSKNGYPILVEVTANYMAFEGQEYNCCIVRDITERKQIEVRIRKNQQVYKTLTQNIPNGLIALINQNLRVDFIDGKELEKFHWRSEALTGKTVVEIFNSTAFAEIESYFNQTFAGETCTFEAESNGQEYIFSTIPMPDAKGDITKIMVLTQCITERRMAEKDILEQAQSRLRVLDSITDGLIILDRTWKVTQINKQGARTLGVIGSEFVGKNFWEVYPSAVDSIFHQEYHRAFAENTEVHFEEYFAVLDVWLEVHAYPSREGLSVYFRDINERKQAEQKLKNTLEELRKRNEELDNYVYKVSHDLRAPLASMLGLVEIIKNEDDIKTVKEYVKLIENRLHKSDDFIHSILNHLQILQSVAVSEKIDFHEIIQDSFEELKYHPNSSKIQLHIREKGDTSFYSDKLRISILFKNVISNAIKFLNPFTDPNYIHIDIAITPKEAVLRVEDNGVGISAEYVHRIFEMFFRANEKSDGSGLGLYIVKQTVEKLHGEISVDSKIGKGTVFTIVLPNLQ
jgi:PAS domain S-box-containing protein